MKTLKIAVIGAGAAGHFAAAAIKRSCPSVDVTIVHDPNTPIIGVGESIAWNGSHFMRHYLGLENDFKWFRKSESVFKYGVEFKGFNDKPESYFSGAPINPSCSILNTDSTDYFQFPANENEYSIYDIWMHLRAKGLGPENIQQALSPTYLWAKHSKSTVSFKKVLSNLLESTQEQIVHSYHFNSSKIGNVIHELVGIPAGVKTLAIKIRQVVLDSHGNIDHLVLDNEQQFHADLFIDATGFARVLAKELPYEFELVDGYINNTAIVGRHAYVDYSEYKPYTTKGAMDYGWHLSITVAEKSGHGYVFNADLAPDTDKLIDELGRTTGKTDVNFRKISWVPGYYKTPFVKNCIVLGISQGFMDPYDSNGFTSTLRHITKIVDGLRQDIANNQVEQITWKDSYNKFVKANCEDIIFRIQTAFHLAPKNNTVYWKEQKIAAAKFHTKEKFIDAIFDPKRRVMPDTKNNPYAYGQHLFVHQAMNFGIELPRDRCLIDISQETERRALEFFDTMSQKNYKVFEHSEPAADFYKKIYS